ncbi:hypothetical protein VTK56DRAFT_359 [Thermocarpiscus australiensis]
MWSRSTRDVSMLGTLTQYRNGLDAQSVSSSRCQLTMRTGWRQDDLRLMRAARARFFCGSRRGCCGGPSVKQCADRLLPLSHCTTPSRCLGGAGYYGISQSNRQVARYLHVYTGNRYLAAAARRLTLERLPVRPRHPRPANVFFPSALHIHH